MLALWCLCPLLNSTVSSVKAGTDDWVIKNEVYPMKRNWMNWVFEPWAKVTEELAESFEEPEGIITKQRTEEFMLALKSRKADSDQKFKKIYVQINVLRI